MRGHRDEPVAKSGHDDGASFLEPTPSRFGDGAGVHGGPAERGQAFHARPGREARQRRARTQAGDADSGPRDLLVQPLGKVEQERLGRVIDRHVRAGLEGGHRGDVEHAPAPALYHGGQEHASQRDHRGQVDLDHVELLVEVERKEAAAMPKSGVVDQHVDGDVAGGERFLQLRRRARLGKVQRKGDALDAMRATQRRCDILEAIDVPRDEHQVVAVGGREPRDLASDSGGCAGDEGGRSLHARAARVFGGLGAVIGHAEASTNRRLLQRAERPLLTLGVALFFVVGYFAVGRADHSTVPLDLGTPLDGLIPFVPASIWVYLWVFPAALIPLFVVRCPRLFRRTACAYAIAIAVSLCCFVLLPITSQHLRADAATLDPRRASDWAVALVYALDPPYNLFPSLHLSIVTLAALSAWVAARRYGAIAFVGVVLVAVAVCTAKQHFVLDVLGGLALGSLAGAAMLGRYRAPADRSPAYSWRGPALHGAMVVVILAALLACHRWLDLSQLGMTPTPGPHGA